jgi:hypothetical protein
VLGLVGEKNTSTGTVARGMGSTLPSGGGYTDLEKTVLALIGEKRDG